MENLSDLKKIFETAVCFHNVEKLEMGGLSGKILSEQLKKVIKANLQQYILNIQFRCIENSASCSNNGQRLI